MNCKRFLTSAAVGLTAGIGLAALPATSACAQDQKPNILFVMTDDVGWMVPGIYHQGMMVGETPNIDRIGKEGVRFLDAYSEQSCTAGRNAFTDRHEPAAHRPDRAAIAGQPKLAQGRHAVACQSPARSRL